MFPMWKCPWSKKSSLFTWEVKLLFLKLICWMHKIFHIGFQNCSHLWRFHPNEISRTCIPHQKGIPLKKNPGHVENSINSRSNERHGTFPDFSSSNWVKFSVAEVLSWEIFPVQLQAQTIKILPCTQSWHSEACGWCLPLFFPQTGSQCSLGWGLSLTNQQQRIW